MLTRLRRETTLVVAAMCQVGGAFWILRAAWLEWHDPLPLIGFPDWHDRLLIWGMFCFFIGHLMHCYQSMADSADHSMKGG